jgi:hypothetical protein
MRARSVRAAWQGRHGRPLVAAAAAARACVPPRRRGSMLCNGLSLHLAPPSGRPVLIHARRQAADHCAHAGRQLVAVWPTAESCYFK